MPASKPVVVGVLFKRTQEGFRILTQLRLVQNKAYDPLYDRTWEAIGETLDGNESVLDAVVRGVREECGKPDFTPKHIVGAEGNTFWSSGRDDLVLACTPLCFLQSLGAPQPWIGPAFAVEVDSGFEPDEAANDGEAGEAKWWPPQELLDAIAGQPSSFMGLHVPALKKLGEDLLAGKIF